MHSKGDLSYIIFLDDTFTLNHPWVKEFCEIYGKEIRVPFSLHARAETVNEEAAENVGKLVAFTSLLAWKVDQSVCDEKS